MSSAPRPSPSAAAAGPAAGAQRATEAEGGKPEARLADHLEHVIDLGGPRRRAMMQQLGALPRPHWEALARPALGWGATTRAIFLRTLVNTDAPLPSLLCAATDHHTRGGSRPCELGWVLSNPTLAQQMLGAPALARWAGQLAATPDEAAAVARWARALGGPWAHPIAQVRQLAAAHLSSCEVDQALWRLNLDVGLDLDADETVIGEFLRAWGAGEQAQVNGCIHYVMSDAARLARWSQRCASHRHPRLQLMGDRWSEAAEPQALFAAEREAGCSPLLAVAMARLRDARALAEIERVFRAFDASPMGQPQLIALIYRSVELPSTLRSLPRQPPSSTEAALWMICTRPSALRLLDFPWQPAVAIPYGGPWLASGLSASTCDVRLLLELVGSPHIAESLRLLRLQRVLQLLRGLPDDAKQALIQRCFVDPGLAAALTSATAQQLTMDLRPRGNNSASFVAFSRAIATCQPLPSGGARREEFARIALPPLRAVPPLQPGFEVHGRTVHLSDPRSVHLALKIQKAGPHDDLQREARMGVLFARLRQQLGLGSTFARPLGLLAAEATIDPALTAAIAAAGIALHARPQALVSELPANYHLNLLDASCAAELAAGLQLVCADQGRVAGHCGLFCYAPAALFHNREHGDRRWYYNVDALGHAYGRAVRRGAGRLERVVSNMRHNNLGLRQLRDLKHYLFVEELLTLREGGSGADRPAYPSARLACTSMMGDWLLTCALIVGVWHRQRRALAQQAEMASLLRGAFVAYFAAFTGRPAQASERFLSAVVDWDRIAQQLRVCLQPEGFSEPDLRAMMGPGVELTCEPGVERWEHCPGEPDLGPFNGPFPLPQLIEALFVVTSFAVELRRG